MACNEFWPGKLLYSSFHKFSIRAVSSQENIRYVAREFAEIIKNSQMGFRIKLLPAEAGSSLIRLDNGWGDP
jgi:hypothetical protein